MTSFTADATTKENSKSYLLIHDYSFSYEVSKDKKFFTIEKYWTPCEGVRKQFPHWADNIDAIKRVMKV